MKDRLAIYMLHRFAGPEHVVDGTAAAELRASLELLRRYDIPILTLREAVERLLEGRPLRGVAFTIDDAYLDFAEVGAPVFQEFDCPATVFVPTGFIDGDYWFWWDKIRLAVSKTTVPRVVLDGAGVGELTLQSPGDREAAMAALVQRVRALPETDRDGAIDEILEALDVGIPDSAPLSFAPMSWDRMRDLGGRGFDFAPHTVSHPSLTGLEGDRIVAEVEGSYLRLSEELSDPAPVFCYPYGTPSDLSGAASEAARLAGMTAAVTALPGYVGPEHRPDPFMLPRFVFPHRRVKVQEVAFGVERLKELLYRGLRPVSSA